MSNPFIQVELDALKRAPLLASVLGIQLREAIGGLTLMWAHVYQEKVETVSAFYLRAFFGTDAAEALVELGFIEPLEGGAWRVRGAGRYTRLASTRSEAGRKGGQASAQAKAGFAQANVKQTPSKPQANETEDEGSVAPETVKQTPSKSQANAGFAQANVKQNAPNTEQKQALEPRAEGSLSESQKGSTPPAPVHARKGPEPVEQPPPDARVLVALARWQRALGTKAPTSQVDDDSVLTVARDFAAEVFVEAVERHSEEGASFWTRTPLRYLRRRCEFAQRDQANAANAPPRAATPRKGYIGEAY